MHYLKLQLRGQTLVYVEADSVHVLEISVWTCERYGDFVSHGRTAEITLKCKPSILFYFFI